MRFLGRWMGSCAAALMAATVLAQPPGAAGPDDPAAGERLDRVLADWDRSWASPRAVEVRFVLVKHFPGWGSEDRYEGTALVARPDRLKVTLDAVEPDPAGGAPRRRFHHQIIASGRSLVVLANDTKQVALHDWGGPGKQAVLQDELMMLLFGMKADEIKERFRVALIRQTPQADLLRLVPTRPGSFARFDLVLDRKTLLPSHLRLVELNGKDTQTYTITKARRDPPGVTDSDFRAAIPKGWTVVDLRRPDPPPAGAVPSGPAVTSEVAPAGPGRARAATGSNGP
jgi:outer membrane lipoprotein-sorting protein